jgi:MarR family 2-MHQ and catechol resistance regulon transcriptional repressor
VRALDLHIALSRASDAVIDRLAEALEAGPLNLAHLGVLEALLHLGPMVQRDLARKLLRSPANVTAVVDQLEARGWVRRERGDDRRCFLVHLTDEGRRVIDEVFPGHVRRLVALCAALSPAEQRELTRLCKKLGLAAARGDDE